MTIGNFVSTRSIGTIFSATTNTYSPYLEVGDEAYADLSRDELIRGKDYQEVLTNFPLASQVLTGLFLDMSLSGPEGPSQTYERALLDRIGYAVRQNGGTPNVSINPDGAPTISEFDMFTLQVLPSLQDTSAVVRLKDELNALTQQESNQLAQNPDPVASATGFENLLRALTVYKSILFLGSSDEATNELGLRQV